MKATRRRAKARGRQALVPLNMNEKMMLAIYRAIPSVRRSVDIALSAAYMETGPNRQANGTAVEREMDKLRMQYCGSDVCIYFVNIHDAAWRQRHGFDGGAR